jgi:hypothetical protein
MCTIKIAGVECYKRWTPQREAIMCVCVYFGCVSVLEEGVSEDTLFLSL